jgi:hypothetical protein
MARSTMISLISRLRLLISDPSGASSVFTDDELQEALDQHRDEIRYRPLEAQPSYVAGPPVSTVYKVHYSDYINWENGAEIVDQSYVIQTPNDSDLINGRWTWTSGKVPTLYISGFSYDLYGAAAMVLDQWIAKIKFDTDFSDQGRSFRESQKVDHLKRLACEYRKKAKIRSGSLLGDAINQSWYVPHPNRFNY